MNCANCSASLRMQKEINMGVSYLACLLLRYVFLGSLFHVILCLDAVT